MKPQEPRNTQDTSPARPQVPARPQLIAVRKTCDATGTGLSHYVLMDKEVRQ